MNPATGAAQVTPLALGHPNTRKRFLARGFCWCRDAVTRELRASLEYFLRDIFVTKNAESPARAVVGISQVIVQTVVVVPTIVMGALALTELAVARQG
jgi:hypothetical protein